MKKNKKDQERDSYFKNLANEFRQIGIPKQELAFEHGVILNPEKFISSHMLFAHTMWGKWAGNQYLNRLLRFKQFLKSRQSSI